MTQKQTTHENKLIEDTYTAAKSAFISAARLKGLHVVKVITEPYKPKERPEDRAREMIRPM